MSTANLPIVAVELFVDRARITRKGTVTLDPADPTVTISNLCPSLDHDSVRVSGAGHAIKLADVRIGSMFEQPSSETISRLQADLDDAKRNHGLASSHAKVLNERARMLTSFAEAAALRLAKTASQPETLSSLVQIGDSVEADRMALATRQQAADEALELATRQVAFAQDALAAATGGGYRTEIALTFDRATDEQGAPTELDLDVSYIVFDAHWRPVHDVTLIESRVRLDTYALISQTTGEDWDEVALRLSTARPGVGSTIPEATPWMIDRVHPIVRARGMTPDMAMPAMATMDAAPMAGGFEAEMAVMASPMAKTALIVEGAEIEHGTSAVYTISDPTSIPPNGTERRVFLGGADLPAAVDRVCAPYQSAEVTIRAVVTNDSPLVILAGDAAIFHDEQFVGRTWLNSLAPSEDVELALGCDDNIKVERKLVRRDSGKSFVGGTRRIAVGYRTTINNHGPKAIVIEVLDRVPHALHEDITVKPEGITPEATSIDDLGVASWKIEVAPNAEATIDLGFTVSHPKGLDVAGLANLG